MRKKLTEFHRENILTAARQLFLQNGFEGTTVEMIAKGADLSKPTIYVYFTSKEEIFACNLLAIMKKFKQVIDEHLIHGKDFTTIYLACCHYVIFLRENETTFFQGIMGSLSYAGSVDAETLEKIKAISSEINNSLKSLFDRGVKENLFSEEIDLGFAYDYVWSCVFGIVSSARLGRKNFDSESSFFQVMDKCFLSVLATFRK